MRAKRNIRVAILDDDGTLDQLASDPTWAFFTAHPDSRTTFGGKRIPAFRQAVALCQRLHDQTPITVLIGWDVTIDTAGDAVLMEFNQGRVETKFPEASIGPCVFRDIRSLVPTTSGQGFRSIRSL